MKSASGPLRFNLVSLFDHLTIHSFRASYVSPDRTGWDVGDEPLWPGVNVRERKVKIDGRVPLTADLSLARRGIINY